jgi:tetratricopeptide (TPR) repeat protein
MRAHQNLAVVYSRQGEPGRAEETLREGVREGERFGATEMLHWLRVSLGLFHAYRKGDWDESFAVTNELIAGARHYEQRAAYGLRADMRVAQGDLVGALSDAARCLELAEEMKDPQALVSGLALAAFVAASAGQLADAEAHGDRVLSFDASLYDVGPTLFYLPWVYRALGRTGELAEAVARIPHPTPWVVACQAIIAGDFARAAKIYGGSSLPWEAYMHLRAAQAGDPAADLQKAIAAFKKMGAAAYLAEAEELLKATA